MKIVMLGSEANPFVKTGGLADVIFALSDELVKKGEEVSVFLPFYNQVKAKVIDAEFMTRVDVEMSWRRPSANILKTVVDGISFYFVENQQYFEREHLYGYDDDGERFAFFSLAVIKAMEALNMQVDIIHLHDWQVGMVPCVIKENRIPLFKKTKFVITIHNPAFLGIIDRYSLGDLYNLPDYLYSNGTARYYDKVSTLKTGIVYADKVTTVSPNHRQELLTPEGGNGLNNVLIYKEYDFCGFLNGIDYEEFNPEKDSYLVANYNIKNFVEGKKKNKEALCERLGLDNKEAPMFALVSRLTWQKGISLVIQAIHEMVARGANVVVLGSGEYEYEQDFEYLHALYPNKVSIYIGFSNELAHQIYASSDFFMMPSLFEPCGLGQMIAQRYGSLPIVRRVGGLKDSVINYDGSNEEVSNGFGFDQFNEWDMVRTCHYALDTYYNQEVFTRLVKNALNTDHSWKDSAELYLGLYKSLI